MGQGVGRHMGVRIGVDMRVDMACGGEWETGQDSDHGMLCDHR